MKTLVTSFAIFLFAISLNAQLGDKQSEIANSQSALSVKDNGGEIAELPADFPKLTISKSENPAPGHLLLTVFSQTGVPSYIMVLDSLGEPLHYKKPAAAGIDLKIAPNGLYTYGQAIAPGEAHNIAGRIVRNAKVIDYIMDADFKIIDSVQCKNEYLADVHEFVVLPNGHYLMLAYESIPVDMSKQVTDGEANAYVIGSVIQELDRNKNCVFQWRSLDHLPINHTFTKLTNSSFEHTHANSYYLDTDGNLLVSFTASFDIVKINMVTGEIIYHFGGKRNQFDIIDDDENTPFHFTNQHDIKRLPNGNFLFFDNGFAKPVQYSRAVEFEVDEEEMTARKVWDFRRQPDISAFAMGSAQRLRNGNTLINWGMIFNGEHTTVTEVNPQKDIVFEASLPQGAFSYRGLKYELPVCRPVADVYVEEAFGGNTYKFKNEKEDTGIELSITQLESFVYNILKMRKYECSPMNPVFEGETPVLIPIRYHLSTDWVYSFTGEMKFDISQLPPRYDYSKMKVYHRKLNGSGVFREVPTTYEMHENILKAAIADSGEFVIGFVRTEKQINPPKLFQPANNAYLLNGKKVKLVWSPTGRYDSFDVQISEDENFENIAQSFSSLTTTSIPADLAESKEYFWRTRTNFKDVVTDWSEIRRFVLDVPGLYITFPVENDTLYKDQTSVIRWITNLTDSLQIKLYKAGVETLLVKDSLFSYTSAYGWKVPSSLTSGDDYTIRISSIKDENMESFSLNFSIQEPVTGVDDDLDNSINTMTIVPNPNKGMARINYNSATSGKVIIRIFDIYGKSLTENLIQNVIEGSNSIELNLSGLPAGVFFCSLSNGENTIVEKLIIVK